MANSVRSGTGDVAGWHSCTFTLLRCLLKEIVTSIPTGWVTCEEVLEVQGHLVDAVAMEASTPITR
jgi:hypothetical protein